MDALCLGQGLLTEGSRSASVPRAVCGTIIINTAVLRFPVDLSGILRDSGYSCRASAGCRKFFWSPFSMNFSSGHRKPDDMQETFPTVRLKVPDDRAFQRKRLLRQSFWFCEFSARIIQDHIHVIIALFERGTAGRRAPLSTHEYLIMSALWQPCGFKSCISCSFVLSA